ncbi:hypothetical protein KUM39_06770 [Streptomyces sp. J2-1]|uniref:hypothetical protein n=1 Tax=Streptomyces corallincola TaxID=2851888 RepID=UPI001C38B1B1|nr:hypothetical protein [Streptomyces corallincola]MBV2354067.1 hypothetical protein [Streptomyces corallincola]
MSDQNGHRDGPDQAHRRPEGVDDTTVEALGALSKALETTERARGHLYAFHQLTGGADRELDRAVRLLHEAGHHTWADRLRSEIVGRNVIPGHWTYQIVEAYNRTYYRPFQDFERAALTALADGRDHLYEAELKEARRTVGHPDHTALPPGPGAPPQET